MSPAHDEGHPPLIVVVEADGGSRGNPGPAGYGAAVTDAATGAVLAERKESIGVATNNVAEYRGLIAGLEAAIELGATSVQVRMDSKLVVEQMSGRWQVKHPDMKPLARRAAELRRQLDSVTFDWIPRERNQHADRLANEAMDAAARPLRDPGTRGSGAPTPGAAASGEPLAPPARLLLIARAGAAVGSPGWLARAGAIGAGAIGAGAIGAVVTASDPDVRSAAVQIAAALGLTAQTDDDLAGPVRDAVAPTRDPRDVTGNGDVDGTELTQLTGRVRRARDRVVRANPGTGTVLVAHPTVIKVLVRLALDAPPSAMGRLHLDDGSLTIIDCRTDGSSVVRLVNGNPVTGSDRGGLSTVERGISPRWAS